MQLARSIRSTTCVLACVLATGCYAYQPLAPGEIVPGTEVRAHLTTEGMVQMESVLGEPRRTVEGELVELSDARVLLLARTGSGALPGQHPSQLSNNSSLAQRVVIPRSDVVQLEQRYLSRSRTMGLTALALGVGGYLLWRAFNFTPGGDSLDGPVGGPDMLRLPEG